MKKNIVLALAILFGAGAAMAQQPTQNQTPKTQQQRQHCGNHGGHGCGGCGNHGKAHGKQMQQQVNADGIDMAVVRAFPTVKSVKKNDKYSPVLDANGKTLGYVVYSKPASDGIKGYAGETPVVIAFNTKKVIIGVYLLPCQETPSYAKHVEDAGLYKNWNGLTAKKALKKNVDAVSGATFTSKAVINSVRAALEKL